MEASDTMEGGKAPAGPQELFQDLFKEEKYRRRLSQLPLTGHSSLVVDFDDLLTFNPELAEALLGKPDEYLPHADKAAHAQLQIEEPEYAEALIKSGVTMIARIVGLPETTPLRALGSPHLRRLIMVEGIVVRSTPVRPLVTRAAFQCKRCEAITYVDQSGPFLRQPLRCGDPACGRSGPFEFMEEKSTFIDSQQLRIQERPEELPPGQLPSTLNVQLLGRDLVDRARPGDHTVIVGTVRATAPSVPRAGKLRTFTLHLDANHVETTSKEPEAISITPEEARKIIELSRDPWIHRNIIHSIAPSIYGYEHVKEAVMYQLFGGVQKHLPDINIRGEINALLIGDPGTGKSQILQYAARIAPRGLYTSGRGTTAAGLTAAVLRSEREGGMTLEAGALVLADKGVCAIDELEKMRPEDRVAIHEVLEQHTVSVAKGGIVATLNARTAVLAAANPALGRYNPYQTIAENVSLPVTILSRFDLIFIMKDVPEKEADTKLSRHILDLHKGGVPPMEPPIPQDLLRKYVAYARTVKPQLTEEAVQRLQEFYLSMRAASETAEASPITITPRQLESLIRISEARARAAQTLERAIYEPEQFPGLIYRMEEPRTSFLLFSSGRLVCAGARREEEVYRAVKKLQNQLKANHLLDVTTSEDDK